MRSSVFVIAAVGDVVDASLLDDVSAMVERKSKLVLVVFRESVALFTVVVGDVVDASALVDVTTEDGGENVLSLEVVAEEYVSPATADVGDSVDVIKVVGEVVRLICDAVIGDSVVCGTVVVGDVFDIAVLVDKTLEVCRDDVDSVVLSTFVVRNAVGALDTLVVAGRILVVWEAVGPPVVLKALMVGVAVDDAVLVVFKVVEGEALLV